MTAPKSQIAESEYQSDPRLFELAFELEESNHSLQKEGRTAAEILAYLRGYADARLKHLKAFVGVYQIGRRFRAMISHRGKAIYVGTYDSELEALAAYEVKAKELREMQKPTYRARVKVEGVDKHLGYFHTAGEKRAAAEAAKAELGIATGRLKGVIYPQRGNRFGARIHDENGSQVLGFFDSEEEAHHAYCRKHAELHGPRSPYFEAEGIA